MNKEEWIDLPDMTAVAVAKEKGWEIEVRITVWERWAGQYWRSSYQYRGRPAQSKTRTVTYECFEIDGALHWRRSELSTLRTWKRVPSEDKTIETPE